MKAINLNEVQEAQEFTKLAPGGYICEITCVEDFPDKEYLKLEYDIIDGEFKDYFRNIYNNSGYWIGNFIRSYKNKALPFFKQFIVAVEKSNLRYKWNNDETTLMGKKLGLVIAEEEYLARDGSVKVRNYVASIHESSKILNGDFKVPALKKLPQSEAPASSGIISTGDEPAPF